MRTLCDLSEAGIMCAAALRHRGQQKASDRCRGLRGPPASTAFYDWLLERCDLDCVGHHSAVWFSPEHRHFSAANCLWGASFYVILVCG